ncbi:hypothetical protein ACSSS7_004323 [Eimeria intestinalis]
MVEASMLEGEEHHQQRQQQCSDAAAMRLTRSSRGSLGRSPTDRPSRAAANHGTSISSNSSTGNSSSRAGLECGRLRVRTNTRDSLKKPGTSSDSSKHNHSVDTKASSAGARGRPADTAAPAADIRCTRSSSTSKSFSTQPVPASRCSTRSAATGPSAAAAATAAKLGKSGTKQQQEAKVLLSEARRRAFAAAPPTAADAAAAAAAGATAAACSNRVRSRRSGGSGGASAALPTPGSSSDEDPLKRVPHQLLKYVRLDARRVSLFGVRDAKQIEGLGEFLVQQFARSSPTAARAAAAAPRLVSVRRKAEKDEVAAAVRAVKRQPAKRKRNQQDKEQQQQQQQQPQQEQQQLEETESSFSEEDLKSDGEGWDEEATATTISLCVSDMQQEPFLSLLQQLQQQRGAAVRLRHLQVDLVGIEWDHKVLTLLRSMLQRNAGSLHNVSLRCRLPSAPLASLLQAIPLSVRALNISENTVEADAVEQLRRLLHRGYLRCLRITNAGLSIDCQRGIVSALETAGCRSSLIWFEAARLRERGSRLTCLRRSSRDCQQQQQRQRQQAGNPHAVLVKNFCFLRYLRLRALAASLVGRRLRVWWQPTDDAARSDFAGRFWPCSVLQHDPSSLVLRVVYDNGEEDFVPLANLQPLHPFAFGGGWVEQQQQQGEQQQQHQQQPQQQRQEEQQQEEHVNRDAKRRAPPQQMRRPPSKRQLQLQQGLREDASSVAAEAPAAASSSSTSSSRSNSCEPSERDHARKAAPPFASLTGIKSRARPQRQLQQKQQRPVQQRLQPRRTRRQQGAPPLTWDPSSAVAAAAAAAAATTSSCCSRCGDPQTSGYSASLPLPEGMEAAAKAFPFLFERGLRCFRPLGLSPASSSSGGRSSGSSSSSVVTQSRDDAAAAAAAAGVEAAPVPLEALGNVLLPGELCEYRDEEEHKGSDPCDYVGLVTKVFSEEPLYELRCIYQEGSERLRVGSKDVRRCVFVLADSWAAWQLALCRQQQPSSLQTPPEPPLPFPNYRLISPVQPQQLDVPPVSSSLSEAKLLDTKAFASLFFERQQAALRCLLDSPDARGLYVRPEDGEKPSHDTNVKGAASSSSSSAEGDSDSSNRESSIQERLLSQVVHPRLQLLLGARFLGLLKRQQLVQRLLLLQRETEMLREQQQRQLTLASECRSLRERAERQQQLQQEAESRLLCLLCVDRKRRVVLLPCAHFYLCPACSEGVSVCPLCRAPIARRLLVKREDDDPEDK